MSNLRILFLTRFLFISCAVLFSTRVESQTYSTISGGSWSTSTNWAGSSIPPNPLPAGDTILLNHAMTYAFSQSVRGVMIVATGASLSTTASTDLSIGNGVTNTGELINRGTINVRNLNVEPGAGCSLGQTLPTIQNFGTVNASNNLNVGSNCGAGSFFNETGGKVNVGVQLHADHYICNKDSIFIGTSFKIHGAFVDCCGYFEAPLLDIDDNGGRTSTISCAQLCASGGGDPTINVQGTDYADLNDAYLNAPTSDLVLDNDSACVCGFNEAGGSCASVVPLPILLKSFKVLSNGNGTNRIEWVTAAELNNDYFTLERANASMIWEPIEKIEGAGNSSKEIEYFTFDYFLPEGLLYYRLKQTDFDGRNTYSPIVQSFDSYPTLGSHNIWIYPNPASNRLFVHGEDIDFKNVKFFNLLGVEVNVSSTGDVTDGDKLQFNTSQLAPGVYLLKHDKTTHRFVIE